MRNSADICPRTNSRPVHLDELAPYRARGRRNSEKEKDEEGRCAGDRDVEIWKHIL
jgi:hypothetical protein